MTWAQPSCDGSRKVRRTRRAALRALAIAQALEGASRADAARVVGRERQSLRDAVVRYNAEGLAGLRDRPRSGRPEKLTAAQREELRAWVLAGPDPEADSMSSYRLLDIAAHVQERWAVSYGLSALSRMLHRMGLSWQTTRPAPPRAMPRRRSSIKNLAATAKSLRDLRGLGAVAAAHPGKALQLWCEDGEAPETVSCEGQKGRTGHRWFTRGVRPPGRRDRRFLSTYIFAAVRPGHDDAFALVLPEARAVTMDLFLARFAETLPAGVQAVLMLDQAGWHGRAALQGPENVTLLPLPQTLCVSALPPYSPELNPVERVWLYLRERFLSFRLYQSEGAIVDALCAAWNALCDETGRLTTLTSYPWIIHAIDQVSK